MKRHCLFILILLCHLSAWSQKNVISGIVKSELTGEKLISATISVPGKNLSVITNEDGYFTLKIEQLPSSIEVAHLGYKSRLFAINKNNPNNLVIELTPTSITMQELIVWTSDASKLVNIAIQKIPANYSSKPELFNCFYRETAMKKQHYIQVAEGVVNMYKTAYNGMSTRDRVAIIKGRRLLSPKQSDTLGVKVMGGPVQPIQLDLVKNTPFLLNEEKLFLYNMEMDEPTTINDRLQFVVNISPKFQMPDPLYFGKFYIDHENLSFTRIELTLDVSDREKATNYMLIRKPQGVRFRPRELSCIIDYKYVDGVSHISYIRNTFRFNCDWKRKLFATSYTACCEMVITDRHTENIQPITGRQSFDSRDAFFDKVDFFKDPNFWENYNIIEPSETLDHAIDKIIKKYDR